MSTNRKHRNDLRTLQGFLPSYGKDPLSLGLYANLVRRARGKFGTVRRLNGAGHKVRLQQRAIAAMIRLTVMNKSIYMVPKFDREQDIYLSQYVLNRHTLKMKYRRVCSQYFHKRLLNHTPPRE